jgi:nucleoside-diphosphate-sugar epimerase
MRFLVTGGTGFIGSHVVELLLANGWDVVCPVRNPSSPRNLCGTRARIIPLDGIECALREMHELDYVIHVAGATRALSYQGYYQANVELTRNLLALLARSPSRTSLKRFILVSSQAASGPSIDSLAFRIESDPPSPVSLYGRSKLEAEHVVASYSGDLPVTIVRPSTVFGPRDVDVLGVFKCARYRVAPCIAGPDRLVSIIYVQDLVDGIVSAALSPRAKGQTYFLANCEPVIWRQFALRVAHVMGYKATAFPVPLPVMRLAARAGDLVGRIKGIPPPLGSEKLQDITQLAWICSSEKAHRDFGWQPVVPLDEAIRQTAAWYREQEWV